MSSDDLEYHLHLLARMSQRGVSKEEVEKTLREGKSAVDAKEGTMGKVMIFPYEKEWEGKHFKQKEVTVYYKFSGKALVLLTVKARYGDKF